MNLRALSLWLGTTCTIASALVAGGAFLFNDGAKTPPEYSSAVFTMILLTPIAWVGLIAYCDWAHSKWRPLIAMASFSALSWSIAALSALRMN